MIEWIAISIAMILLWFAYQAFRCKELFWFFHDVNHPFQLTPENQKKFNHRIGLTLVLFACVFFLPTLCYMFHWIKESLYIMMMCSSMTILIFITMIYWHHLYKKFDTY